MPVISDGVGDFPIQRFQWRERGWILFSRTIRLRNQLSFSVVEYPGTNKTNRAGEMNYIILF